MLLQVTPRWAVHCHGLLTVAKGCGPLAQSIDRLGRQRQQRERRTTVATSATTAVVPALQPQPQQQQPQQQQQQQQQRANPMHWLVHNGEGQRCQLSSGDWLKAAPRGAYTTARTAAGGSRVFELQMHLDRLAESARLMMQADVDVIADAATASAAAALSGTLEQQLRPRVLASLRAAVAGFRSAAAQDASTTATATTAAAAPHDGELKLTVLVTWPGSEQQQQRQEHAAAAASPSSSVAADADLLDVWVHISPLPPRPAAPVRAVVRGAPRQNAEAKDSEWVRQRRELEASMPVGVNEVVLVGAGGSLYEGLSSNFFAVIDGAVHTAGQGVLAGTVRRLALEVAARLRVPVVLEPPLLADLDRWEGAFITSTSRLLLPLNEISVPPPSPPSEGSSAPTTTLVRSFELGGGLVQRLEAAVLDAVVASSEPLFDE